MSKAIKHELGNINVYGKSMDWLNGMETKYTASDINPGTGSPLEQALNGWAMDKVTLIKANLKRTKTMATKSLMQSVVPVPMFDKAGKLCIQIMAEDYIDYVDKGVSGTRRKRGDGTYKFKTSKPGRAMIKAMQTYVAAKPIKLGVKPGVDKRKANLSAAFAIATSVKQNGIKARRVYSKDLGPKSPAVSEIKQIIEQQYAGAFAAEIAVILKSI